MVKGQNLIKNGYRLVISSFIYLKICNSTNYDQYNNIASPSIYCQHLTKYFVRVKSF
jgi:hypothetical protein